MNRIIQIARIVTGVLFIFSGLVKAIDPRGLAYKMEEFFEVWAAAGYMAEMMHWLTKYSLTFFMLLITLEVVVGVALLIGWKKRFTVSLLLLLMILFTFLTGYALFSGKIKSCGCFGECIPLTLVQTFVKDIVLLVLSIFLLFNFWRMGELFKPIWQNVIIAFTILAVFGLQFYVLRNLPLVDCLHFKEGNNILELRKMPANAVPDEYSYNFIYEKEGNRQSFAMNNLPDSSWTFVERKQELVKAGSNNVPLITDFILYDSTGTDVTEALLSQKETYYLVFLREVTADSKSWIAELADFVSEKKRSSKVYLITSQKEEVTNMLNKHNILPTAILTCDATAIKTAARAIPTIYQMEGPVVEHKWGWPYLSNFRME